MAIALVYLDQKYNKHRIRQIPSTELDICPGADHALTLLRSKYRQYFEDVDADQVDKIVHSLFENPISHSQNHNVSELDLDEDLNKVAPEKLLVAKTLMNDSFEKNRLRPGQDGYVYDKRAEFQPTQKNEWDDQDMFTEIEDEINFSAADASDDEGYA